MIVTKTVIPRRTVLRGVGAALALPLLDGMVPALTALSKTAAAPARRLGVVTIPNGAPVEFWQPLKAGAEFEWTPTLKPLAPVREHLLVMTNLDSVGAERGRGTTHSQAASALLTGARPRRTTGAQLELGISMDQVAANAAGVGRETQLALAGAVDRGRRHRLRGGHLRRRLQLRLPEQLVGQPHDADAARDEPAPRLRAPVR